MSDTIGIDKWNANLYDDKHAFVSQYGENLIGLLAPNKGENILDLGCGTGDIAKKLNDMGAFVTGVDKSENMIHQAHSKYPQMTFTVADATELDFTKEFDAVFSNAALHWVKSPKKALDCIYNSLKTGGRFVAEFGGNGNVQMMTAAVIEELRDLGLPFHEDRFPWFFPSIAEYTTMMEEAGFKVTFAHHFDRPTPLEGTDGLRNWLNMFASTMFEEVDMETTNTIITNVENKLKDCMFKENTWIADYKRLRVVGLKA